MSAKTEEAAASGWQDEFKLRPGLVQADVYAYTAQLAKLGGVSNQGASVVADHALKAAIKAGWLEAPASEVLQGADGKERFFLDGVEIDKMHPGKVLWYGSQVVQHYARSVEIPPN